MIVNRKPSITHVIPNSDHSRSNGIISTATHANYLNVRLLQLDFDYTGAANLQNILVDALESFITPAQLKEINDTVDRADGLDYLTNIMSILQTVFSQLNIRLKCPAYVGGLDAAGTTTADVWLTDDWEHFLVQLAKVPIPVGLIKLIKLLNPIMITALPQLKRRFREAQLLMWAPHMTISEAYTKLGTLKTYTGAARYFELLGIKMEHFSLSSPIVVDARQSTPYTYWLRRLMWLLRRNTADTGVFALSHDGYMVATEILDAALETGFYTATTWYTGLTMSTLAGSPFSDLYAISRILGLYDATHNNVGSVVPADDACLGTTLAGDKIYSAYITHKATSFTIAPETAIVNYIPMSDALYDTETTHTLTKLMGDGNSFAPQAVWNPGSLGEYLNMSSTWMDDVERVFFTNLILKGGQVNEGSNNNTRTSKRPDSRARTNRSSYKRSRRKKKRVKKYDND